MRTIATFIYSLLAGAAALPLLASAQQQDGMSRVEVRRFISVDKACPGVDAALPAALYATWPVIDTPREVRVEFMLDGVHARDVKIIGGYCDNYDPVRRAVHALHCRSPGDGVYAVRFRLRFEELRDD